MKNIFVLIIFGTVVLAASGSLKLSINGIAQTTPALVQNGKTYIPLEALQKAGIKAVVSKTEVRLELPQPAGGTMQRASLEGCLGETLFNGVWRIKVSKLEPIKKDGTTPGWGLMLELKNGSPATIMPIDAGFDGSGQGVQLAFSDASTLNVDPMDVQKMTFASLPPGGAITHQAKFYYPFGTVENSVQKPTKLLLELSRNIGDSTKAKGVAFTVPNPSLRVRLDCQK
ncbi:MAG: hypothetical protein ACK41E_09135 [Deinococcales bacterium]